MLLFWRKKRGVGEYVDEAVYGANDGIITTFAVISGATGASLGIDTIIILGLANLIADGFSMGASSYLSIRTEEDVNRIQGFLKSRNLDAVRRSSATFIAFVCAGMLPLIPFFFLEAQGGEFVLSALSAGCAFFVVGGLRTIVTKRGFLISGVEMLLVGGIASALAYATGYIVHAIIT